MIQTIEVPLEELARRMGLGRADLPEILQTMKELEDLGWLVKEGMEGNNPIYSVRIPECLRGQL
jgi:DNA-binding IclR family transcriptional regulator